MSLIQQTLLLFTLNFADAVLTIFWVRNGFATEGNHLMATLLDIGNFPFLSVKVAIGAVAALVLWNWGHLRLAKYGLALVLMLYTGLMGIHFVTGLSAVSMVAGTTLTDLPAKLFSFVGMVV